MNEEKYIVYMHTSPSGKHYIGITSVGCEARWRNGRGYAHNRHFRIAIKKYGWENIKHEILFENLTKEEAEKKEVELIAKYKSNQREFGYNIENGGNANKVSEETRLKMSLAKKGLKYKKRRNRTEEEKRAISQQLKGRVSPMKGKHWSVEQREKVGKRIVCVETGQEFYSLREAERKTGIKHNHISNCCKGINKTSGGFHWKYA